MQTVGSAESMDRMVKEESIGPSDDTTIAMQVTVKVLQPKSGSVPAMDLACSQELPVAWGPEGAVLEEERLQATREAAEAVAKPKAVHIHGAKALDELLYKSGMYSRFLAANQAADIARHAAEAAAIAEPGYVPPAPVAEPAAAGKGKKGKAAPAAKKGTKRGRAAEPEEPHVPVGPVPIPGTQQALVPLLRANLRDYQLHGIKWLVSLYNNGMNGILADQMGLGKTVQAIGFLSHLKAKGVHGPFLVLGPLSTLPNWINEFNKFCPDMPALLYHGTRPEREALMKTRLKCGTRAPCPAEMPVIVTSYEILMADVKELQQFNYKYIIVDEGHRLKNFNCRLVRDLKTLRSQNRTLLTGTPLQNNLAELWSLLNFIMPEVFASLANFEAWFDFSDVGQDGAEQALVASEQRVAMVSKLHSILQPFVLRRIKADVDIALPLKSEILLYAPMTETQKMLNKQLLENTILVEMARMVSEGGGTMGAASKLNNVLMQMRKNCNHPDLITSAFLQDITYPSAQVLVEQCGKMALLDRLLKELHARGHKVLIFSQMTKMLDLLESYLEQLGHSACRIDGSVPFQERQKSINDFNNDPNTWLFLLSTRAGGLGINLTGADTVIIYDSDWNPHQDMQAMDRCHRIGQTKPVVVFRLATSYSVEGKMLKRAEDKLMLERLVIKKGAFKQDVPAEGASAAGSSMSAAELLELLKPECAQDRDIPQSAVISDEVLTSLLDRRHLVLLAEGQTAVPAVYPRSGVGYRVLAGNDGSSMLNTIDAGPPAGTSDSVSGEGSGEGVAA